MDDITDGSSPEVLILRTSIRKRKAVQPSQARKRRLAAGIRRIRKGRLEKISDLPVDVLFEIFGWLDPVDLLHLSRTSRSWRSLLMTRSSISVWRAARSNLPGFPDCPNDLSEPQYADLAFGTTCYFCCGTFTGTRLIWAARLRTCGWCLRIHFLTPFDLEKESKDSPLEWKSVHNLPHFSVLKRTGCMRWTNIYVPRDIYVELLDQYSKAQDKDAWLTQYKEKHQTMKLHAEAFASWHCHRPTAKDNSA